MSRYLNLILSGTSAKSRDRPVRTKRCSNFWLIPAIRIFTISNSSVYEIDARGKDIYPNLKI